MKNLFLLVRLVAPLGLVWVGVGCTTSEYSRQRAAKAVALLDTYEKEQSDRIEKLTEEFVKVETKLRQDHINELERWLHFDRDADDLRLADSLSGDWPTKTLPSAVMGQLIESKEREIERVNKRRRDVIVAREIYQKAYQELELPLKKVKAAKDAMKELAEKDASGPDLKKVYEIFNEVYKQYEKDRAEEEKKRKELEKEMPKPANPV